jgi:hypothetical protein
MAIAEGAVVAEELIPMKEVVTGHGLWTATGGCCSRAPACHGKTSSWRGRWSKAVERKQRLPCTHLAVIAIEPRSGSRFQPFLPEGQ